MSSSSLLSASRYFDRTAGLYHSIDQASSTASVNLMNQALLDWEGGRSAERIAVLDQNYAIRDEDASEVQSQRQPTSDSSSIKHNTHNENYIDAVHPMIGSSTVHLDTRTGCGIFAHTTSAGDLISANPISHNGIAQMSDLLSKNGIGQYTSLVPAPIPAISSTVARHKGQSTNSKSGKSSKTTASGSKTVTKDGALMTTGGAVAKKQVPEKRSKVKDVKPKTTVSAEKRDKKLSNAMQRSGHLEKIRQELMASAVSVNNNKKHLSQEQVISANPNSISEQVSSQSNDKDKASFGTIQNAIIASSATTITSAISSVESATFLFENPDEARILPSDLNQAPDGQKQASEMHSNEQKGASSSSPLVDDPRDLSINYYETYHMFPPQQGESLPLKAKRDRNRLHTPRPSNSFILYRREKHSEIMSQYKGAKALNNNVISKIVATMWRQEDPEVKARYAAKAEDEKRLHMLKYPDYKYRPRKSPQKGPAKTGSPRNVQNSNGTEDFNSRDTASKNIPTGLRAEERDAGGSSIDAKAGAPIHHINGFYQFPHGPIPFQHNISGPNPYVPTYPYNHIAQPLEMAYGTQPHAPAAFEAWTSYSQYGFATSNGASTFDVVVQPQSQSPEATVLPANAVTSVLTTSGYQKPEHNVDDGALLRPQQPNHTFYHPYSGWQMEPQNLNYRHAAKNYLSSSAFE